MWKERRPTIHVGDFAFRTARFGSRPLGWCTNLNFIVASGSAARRSCGTRDCRSLNLDFMVDDCVSAHCPLREADEVWNNQERLADYLSAQLQRALAELSAMDPDDLLREHVDVVVAYRWGTSWSATETKTQTTS